MDKAGKLLVVDDEEANRDILSRRLARSGFEVEMAANGPAALRAVETGGYDLVLLDSMMPEMSGIEVLKLLRAVRAADDLPVIMVTAVTDSESVAEAIELGANDYITKPVDFRITLARVRAQLKRRRDQLARRNVETRYALAEAGSRTGILDWDLKTGRVYYSDSWKQQIGYLPREVGESPEEWLQRVADVDRPAVQSALNSLFTGPAGGFEVEYRIRHKSGSWRWMMCRAASSHDESGTPVRLAGSQSDITSRRTTDPLTGLPNREALIAQIQTALTRQSPAAKPFALLFINLDRFTLINDGSGRAAGDVLLSEVAARLVGSVRSFRASSPPDLVARIGGDEFAVFLDGVPDAEAAMSAALRLMECLRPAFTVAGAPLFCTASIGVALGAPGAAGPDDYLREASMAMSEAKASGKARCLLFQPSMRNRAERRLRLESDLRRAIDDRQFAVYYQPRVVLETGCVHGFEALVRWEHPERGLVMPSEFVPLAEEIGMIGEIGMFVMREACRQVKEWEERFPAVAPLDLSVNVSPRQCLEPGLVEKVAAVIQETGIRPANLQLEITENLLMNDISHARRVLQELKDLGVGLKIDDFGTGYSSLSYLSDLPFDALKIDRSFTSRMDEDAESAELVRTILSLASNLHLEVIAEGVETQRQAELLKKAGCRFGQGFLFSKPLDAGEAEALLARAEGVST